MKDNHIFQNFLHYIYFNSSGRFKKIFGDRYQIEDSQSLIKKYGESYFYKTKYPFVWGPIIYDRLSRKDYFSFLKSSLIPKKLNDCLNCLLFYRDLHSIPRANKEDVLDGVERLKKKKSLYHKEVFLRLLSDESFFKTLKANSEDQIKPLFHLKRELYQKMLKSGISLEYSIFQLALLGDFPRENLMEIILLHEDV